MRAVSNATPSRWVKVLPDATQADGHPLTEQRVRVRQLLQAVGDEVPLQTGLLRSTSGERRQRRAQTEALKL